MGYDPAAGPASPLLLGGGRRRAAGAAAAATLPARTAPLLASIRDLRARRFPDAVALTRVGDFYEAYGVDAILLVEHCGLNPMAGKARAGCPWRNVQATLDGLTRAGFRTAVYEERPDGAATAAAQGTGAGGRKAKLKARYLAQVVSAAHPTYLHGLVLGGDPLLAAERPGRPYVGVVETRAGFTLVEVSAEERTAAVSERLTGEAVRCRLEAYPPADPLLYVPPSPEEVSPRGARRTRPGTRPPFLPRPGGAGDADGRAPRVRTLPPALAVGPRPGLSEAERAKRTIVAAFQRLEDAAGDSGGAVATDAAGEGTAAPRPTPDDFVTITASPAGDDNDARATSARPLHAETATQLGLLADPSVPPLLASLVPDAAPSSARRFLRRWLLVPPPPRVADAMARLVRALKEDPGRRPLPGGASPGHRAPPLAGKVLSLVRARQASAAVYKEVLVVLDVACEVLRLDDDDHEGSSAVVSPLITILAHDTGVGDGSSDSAVPLLQSFVDAMVMIEGVVCTHGLEHSLQNIDNGGAPSEEKDYISYFGSVVPSAFFERNEAPWRGRVKLNTLGRNSHDVSSAAKLLAEAVAVDFWGVENVTYETCQSDDDESGDDIINLLNAQEKKNPVVQDLFNNIVAIKSVPKWSSSLADNDDTPIVFGEDGLLTSQPEKKAYFHPRDRHGKILRNRYTTERVQNALSDYVEACSNARSEVERVLTTLSSDVISDGHLPAISQASHLNLVFSTAALHAANSNAKGWNVATVYDSPERDNQQHAPHETGLDDPSSAGMFRNLWPYWMDRSQAVSNTFRLDGLFLITAPNMSGKSTLMRSTAAAALLINSGLCAPVGPGSSVRRFDSLFVRGASADIPTEDKSAFGAEMGDVAALFRSCGGRSLVFVDEIGRGTSPKDGTSLAGAILEKMAESEMSGMFATHLHGVLELPYSSLAEDRLKKKRMAISKDSDWTYLLEDGVCTNSLALLTAAKFGLSSSILKRAEELSRHWDDNRNTAKNEPAACVEELSSAHNIHDAVTVLEEVVGEGSRSIQIPPHYMPPPSLEGSSCVYILQVGNGKGKSSGIKYYVGETDSLSQRLSQHRSRKGEGWSSLSAIAIRIDGGKSLARNVESLVIQRMARMGFDLVSVADGFNIRSLGRKE